VRKAELSPPRDRPADGRAPPEGLGVQPLPRCLGRTEKAPAIGFSTLRGSAGGGRRYMPKHLRPSSCRHGPSGGNGDVGIARKTRPSLALMLAYLYRALAGGTGAGPVVVTLPRSHGWRTSPPNGGRYLCTSAGARSCVTSPSSTTHDKKQNTDGSLPTQVVWAILCELLRPSPCEGHLMRQSWGAERPPHLALSDDPDADGLDTAPVATQARLPSSGALAPAGSR